MICVAIEVGKKLGNPLVAVWMEKRHREKDNLRGVEDDVLVGQAERLEVILALLSDVSYATLLVSAR